MKILITGGDGLLGTAFKRIAVNFPQHKFLFVGHKNFDLTSSYVAERLLEDKYDCIINCAALIGNDNLNKEYSADLFNENMQINMNIISAAHKAKVPKLFVFASSAAFDPAIYPLKETLLQIGQPSPTNYFYGYVQRMIDIQIQSYNQQYGCNYCTVIPINPYGIGDNFAFNGERFIPTLIHKAYLAKKYKNPFVIWGDGCQLRELLYSEDLAKIVIHLAERNKLPHDKYLVSNNIEVSIADIADEIAEIIDIGPIVFDATKPSGELRKPVDLSRLRNVIGDFKFTDYKEGLAKTIRSFVDYYEFARR